MNLEVIYDKLRTGNPVSDKEIDYAIPKLIETEANLLELGSTFLLARREVSQVLALLQQFKNHRKRT